MFDFIGDVIGWIVSAPFVILGWLIVGAIAGDLARRVTKSQDRGCLSDWILGVVGAIVGGLLASPFGVAFPDSGLMLVVANLIVATIGAVALIALRRALFGNRT
jgi:uncharacterized membrane protein YeaQ/YmgE (transglycosylase-associated protein family)